MKRQLILLVILLVLPLGAAHAQKRAFTIEDLYRIRSISDVHLSPDGNSIIYVLTASDFPRAKRNSHVWMMNADGQNSRQLTNGDKSEFTAAFSPDGKWISYVSAKDGAPQLYVMPSTVGEARKVTNISTGISDPLWSPDGKWIAVSSAVYPA